MEFVLRWSDDVRAGNVQVNGKSGTYEVRIPVSVEQVSSRDLGCGISTPIQPAVTPIRPTSLPSSRNTLMSRVEALILYDSIYKQQGWCNLWGRLIADNLVEGACPQWVNQYAREDIDTGNGTVNLVTGAQMRIASDIRVNYPACITFGKDANYVTYSGGIVESWTPHDYVATNLTLHTNSFFTLYFRCDNAWSP